MFRSSVRSIVLTHNQPSTHTPQTDCSTAATKLVDKTVFNTVKCWPSDVCGLVIDRVTEEYNEIGRVRSSVCLFVC